MKKTILLLKKEIKDINWSITKFEKDIFIDLPIFPYQTDRKKNHFATREIFLRSIDKSSFMISGPGGCGKTNLAISMSKYFHIPNIYFGKNILNLDFLTNKNRIIIDAVNEIKDINLFNNLIDFIKTNKNVQIIITCREGTRHYEILRCLANDSKLKIFNIDWSRNLFDWNFIDFSKFDNPIKVLAFIIVKRYIKNNRNINFLYSCITSNNFLRTSNNGNVIGVIRDVIEQTFKKHKQNNLWQKLKKSSVLNNLFKSLSELEKEALVKMGFIYKDEKFDIEEVFHKLVCEEPWTNKKHDLYEYGQAYKSISRKLNFVFSNFKNYCLFLACHPNPKDISFKPTNNSCLMHDDEIEYSLFFKSQNLEKIFNNNIKIFIDFYKNYSKKFGHKNDLLINYINFNKYNYLFLFSFILIKDDDISSLALKKFLNFYKITDKYTQGLILKNLQNILKTLNSKFQVEFNFTYHYMFTRFCFILKKINEMFLHNNKLVDLSDYQKCLLSVASINSPYFALKLLPNTYLEKCFNLKMEDQLNIDTEPYSDEEMEFINWFDRHHFHNRKVIESPPIDWLSNNFEFWLNTEPLFEKIWNKTPIRIGLGYPTNSFGSYDTFTNDKFGYIIDVFLWHISSPRKKRNPDSYFLKQRGVYKDQNLLPNIPYYMRNITLDYAAIADESFLNVFNNINIITFEQLTILDRVKYSLKILKQLISHKKLIAIDETYDSRTYNTCVALNYSNNNEECENKHRFADSNKKYCYKHFNTDEDTQELFFNDKKCKYYYDNIHRYVVLSENKNRYKNFKWWLSLTDDKYWVDIECINNKVCYIHKSIHVIPGITKRKVPYNMLITTLKKLLKD